MDPARATSRDEPRPVLTLPWLPEALQRNLPPLFLMLCSITFAEFLTGSTPVLVPILNPLSAAFLLGLYGAGVLLVREATIRWNKGWPTVLLLGAAYGIVEEGIGTKTFFGPKGVGTLAVYGHVAGINWVWATELALFHAVFSIALPIVAVGLLFPASDRAPFLPTRRSRILVLLVFLATVAAMFVLFNANETPPAALLLASLAVVGLLVALARWAPASLGGLRIRGAGTTPVAHPFLVGAAFVWGFFGLSWVAPELVPVPAIVAAALVAWSVAFGVFVARYRESFARPAVRLDFLLGALSFSLVLAAVLGILGDFAVLPVIGAVLVIGWRLRLHLAAPREARAPVRARTAGPVV